MPCRAQRSIAGAARHSSCGRSSRVRSWVLRWNSRARQAPAALVQKKSGGFQLNDARRCCPCRVKGWRHAGSITSAAGGWPRRQHRHRAACCCCALPHRAALCRRRVLTRRRRVPGALWWQRLRFAQRGALSGSAATSGSTLRGAAVGMGVVESRPAMVNEPTRVRRIPARAGSGRAADVQHFRLPDSERAAIAPTRAPDALHVNRFVDMRLGRHAGLREVCRSVMDGICQRIDAAQLRHRCDLQRSAHTMCTAGAAYDRAQRWLQSNAIAGSVASRRPAAGDLRGGLRHAWCRSRSPPMARLSFRSRRSHGGSRQRSPHLSRGFCSRVLIPGSKRWRVAPALRICRTRAIASA